MSKRQEWLIAFTFVIVGLFVGLISGHFPAWDGLPMRVGVILAVAFAGTGSLFAVIFAHYARQRFAVATYVSAVVAIGVGFTIMCTYA